MTYPITFQLLTDEGEIYFDTITHGIDEVILISKTKLKEYEKQVETIKEAALSKSINEFQQLINQIEDNTERAKALLDAMLSLYK